jgi:hypothetical protein
MTFELRVRVTYDETTVDRADALEAQLKHCASHLANNGMLSGDDPVIVDEWHATVERLD